MDFGELNFASIVDIDQENLLTHDQESLSKDLAKLSILASSSQSDIIINNNNVDLKCPENSHHQSNINSFVDFDQHKNLIQEEIKEESQHSNLFDSDSDDSNSTTIMSQNYNTEYYDPT